MLPSKGPHQFSRDVHNSTGNGIRWNLPDKTLWLVTPVQFALVW